MNQKNSVEGYRNFDLKPLTKEEVAWLEEHFMDFAREQYLVRWDDIREALKIAQHQKELQRQDKWGNKRACQNRKVRADRVQITLP